MTSGLIVTPKADIYLKELRIYTKGKNYKVESHSSTLSRVNIPDDEVGNSDHDWDIDRVHLNFDIVSSERETYAGMQVDTEIEETVNKSIKNMNKIMGSKKAVICTCATAIYAVEKWRISQGFDPTPEDQLKNLEKMGGALGIEKEWIRYPAEGREAVKMTYQEFLDRLAGKPDFESITTSMRSLLEYKNQKYGNSALEPMLVFSGKTKLGTRLDDKLARIKNGTELRKNDVADCMGYLMLICAENGWDNFDELKD